MDAIGIVSVRRDRIMNRQQQDAQLCYYKKDLRRHVKLARLSRFFLHKNGNVLIEQIHDHHHCADKEPVQGIVQQLRNHIQMVHGVDRSSIKDQMDQRYDQ